MTTNKAIGIYDSGVGGLTVLKELASVMPSDSFKSQQFIYFGDLKNLPYGEKSKEELLKIGKKIFDFFEAKNVKAVIMACNTTSATIYDELKDLYGFKIYPIIQTVSKELAELNIKKLGVFATSATIKSHAYKKEIGKFNPDITVFEQECPDWVKIVESGEFNKKDVEIIKADLEKMLKNSPEKIVLGCTHYPYLIDILSQFAPKELFINPAEKFAKLILEDLTKTGLIKENEPKLPPELNEQFFVSKNPEGFIKSSKMFYPVKIKPKIADLKK